MSVTTHGAKLYLATFQHRDALWDPLLNEYYERIQKLAQLEWKIFKPPLGSPESVRLNASQSFIQYLAKFKLNGPVIILDERGAQLTTKTFSAKLSKLINLGAPISFVVGGAEGLALEPLMKLPQAECLTLSGFTLPHRLAQLVLLEQLYRALMIINNLPYHRD